MIRIICDNCKNAYLQEQADGFNCPSCNAHFDKNKENSLLGVQYYKEGLYSESDDCLMKAIVEDGTDAKALFYKGLCEGKNFDEDTLSLSETYRKLAFAFEYAKDEEYPMFIELADSEMKTIEKDITELHLNSFTDADAEKIKKEVAFILKIRDEALNFRKALEDLANKYNDRNESEIILNLSDCYYVDYDSASEIGDKKLRKIKDDVASHTVFTGILSSDIKNLEIYYRCVVMFFKKSKAKYDFLLENAKKFASLNGALETGNYTGVTSPLAASERLKSAAYNFFEESLKEYEEEKEPAPAVVLKMPEVKEPEIEEESEIAENSEVTEDTEAENVEEATEESINESETEEASPAEGTPEEESEEITEEAVEENKAEEIEIEPTENEEPALETIPEEEKEPEITDISSNSLTENRNDEPEKTEEVTENISPEDGVVDINEFIQKSEEAESTAVDGLHAIADSMGGEEAPKEDNKSEEFSEEKEDVKEATSEDDALHITFDEDISAKKDEDKSTLAPRKKNRKPLIILLVLIVAFGGYFGVKYVPNIINDAKYKNASTLLAEGNCDKAESVFASLGEYKDSADKVSECKYTSAEQLLEKGEYQAAAEIYAALGEYKDCVTKLSSSKYEAAKAALEKGNYDEAEKIFKELGKYGDSATMVKECTYKKALNAIENKAYEDAVTLLKTIKGYSDASNQLKEAKYGYVTENFDKSNKTTVSYLKELAKAKFRNSAELKKKLLGTTDTSSSEKKISVAVNNSKTDNKTANKSVSAASTAYFHITASSKAIYNEPITLSYTTEYGYTESTTVTLTSSNKTDYMSYYAYGASDYTVTFTATASDGTKLGSVTVTME